MILKNLSWSVISKIWVLKHQNKAKNCVELGQDCFFLNKTENRMKIIKKESSKSTQLMWKSKKVDFLSWKLYPDEIHQKGFLSHTIVYMGVNRIVTRHENGFLNIIRQENHQQNTKQVKYQLQNTFDTDITFTTKVNWLVKKNHQKLNKGSGTSIPVRICQMCLKFKQHYSIAARRMS